MRATLPFCVKMSRPLDSQSSRPAHAMSDRFVGESAWSAEALPSWLDSDQVAVGASVFRRYFPLIYTVLFHRSLVGGFSAPKISKVLEKSGYLLGSPAFVEKRLLETGSKTPTLPSLTCCRP